MSEEGKLIDAELEEARRKLEVTELTLEDIYKFPIGSSDTGTVTLVDGSKVPVGSDVHKFVEKQIEGTMVGVVRDVATWQEIKAIKELAVNGDIPNEPGTIIFFDSKINRGSEEIREILDKCTFFIVNKEEDVQEAYADLEFAGIETKSVYITKSCTHLFEGMEVIQFPAEVLYVGEEQSRLFKRYEGVNGIPDDTSSRSKERDKVNKTVQGLGSN